VEPGSPVFFYSKRDKGLMSSIINASANLGCVKDTLIQTGNGTVAYPGGRRTRKVHEIFPSQNTNGTYTLTLYYTASELAGFTVAPSQLRILKSNAATIDASTFSNSIIVTPTAFIDSSAQGFYGYTYTFNGFSKFALVEPSTSPLPINCLDFKATKGTGSVVLSWKVNSDLQGSFDVERSSDGVTFEKLTTLTANGSGQYSFADRTVAGLKTAAYRVKATEATAAARYLCSILNVSFDGRNIFTIGDIYPNPGKGAAGVNVTLGSARKLRIEFLNTVGQTLNAQQTQLAAGASRVTLNVAGLAAGSYLVRFRDEDGTVVSTQQYIKQ
ncbi:MAG TPA: T9SS type A sorting domain-containing protein, partial [Flavisolibacter sp.]|nr:T9SS type A sorting domain-containing protein [Flavisolibacter sp.]